VVTNVARVRGGGDSSPSVDGVGVTVPSGPGGERRAGSSGHGPGALLPDTGGPALWPLLAGLLLLGSGGGLLLRGRRDRQSH